MVQDVEIHNGYGGTGVTIGRIWGFHV